MKLRPLAVTRIANLVPGIIVLAWAVTVDRSEGVRAGMVVLALWLSYRGYNLGVVLSQNVVRIRGWLWSRSVPVERVSKVTLFAGLRWRTSSGKARWSPILAFAEPTSVIPRVSRHNDWAVNQIEDWIFRHRPR